MLRCSARPRCAAALLLLALSIGYAAAVRTVPAARQILQDSSLPTYQLVEYIGTSGATLTTDEIAKFPSPPDNVLLSWVVAFVGDATSDTTPSGTFGCTGGSFCSGSDLDQDLITALKGAGGSNLHVSTCVNRSSCSLSLWTTLPPCTMVVCSIAALLAQKIALCGQHAAWPGMATALLQLTMVKSASVSIFMHFALTAIDTHLFIQPHII